MDLNQETLGMALQYLDKIGEKIGMTADTIWPWLVKQQYVYFGISFTILAIGLMCIPFAIHMTNKYHPWDDKIYGTEDVSFTRAIRCATPIMAFVFTIIGIGATICNIPKLFNPEYYALTSLMELIK